MEGCIIKEGSDEHTDQEEYKNKKKDKDNYLLRKVNEGIQEDKYKSYRLEGDDSEHNKMISLRNTFNYQMRACQTFNHVLKEKGVKTDPPQMEKLSMETTQWQIFDAYMKEYLSRMEKEAEEQKQRSVKEKRSN